MEDETREAFHVRRAKRFQAMITWLEAQAKVNAQEGTPRDEPCNADLVDSNTCRLELPRPDPDTVSIHGEPQRLITSFFCSVGGR